MSSSDVSKRRRGWIVAATGAAGLVAVGALAFALLHHPSRSTAADDAQHGRLQVEMGKAAEEKLDPAKPLRCFVNGQFVGQATLAECAAKNGVSSQNLDVGLDPGGSGEVAAQAGAPVPLQPLPQVQAQARETPGDLAQRRPDADADADGDDDGPARAGAPLCLRYAGGSWRTGGPEGASLRACVHALYEDRCVRPGEALYGRYGGQTLRLVPGRVEIANDNRTFRPLVGQDPDSCSLDN